MIAHIHYFPQQWRGQAHTYQVSSKSAHNGHITNLLHQVMTEFQEAGVAFTMMVELRNKLLESYKELMSMGL